MIGVRLKFEFRRSSLPYMRIHETAKFSVPCTMPVAVIIFDFSLLGFSLSRLEGLSARS